MLDSNDNSAPAKPRLTIRFILLWMFFTGLCYGIWRWQGGFYFFDNPSAETMGLSNSIWGDIEKAIHLCEVVIFGAALASLSLCCNYWHLARFPSQPGHHFLIVLALFKLMAWSYEIPWPGRNGAIEPYEIDWFHLAHCGISESVILATILTLLVRRPIGVVWALCVLCFPLTTLAESICSFLFELNLVSPELWIDLQASSVSITSGLAVLAIVGASIRDFVRQSHHDAYHWIGIGAATFYLAIVCFLNSSLLWSPL